MGSNKRSENISLIDTRFVEVFGDVLPGHKGTMPITDLSRKKSTSDRASEPLLSVVADDGIGAMINAFGVFLPRHKFLSDQKAEQKRDQEEAQYTDKLVGQLKRYGIKDICLMVDDALRGETSDYKRLFELEGRLKTEGFNVSFVTPWDHLLQCLLMSDTSVDPAQRAKNAQEKLRVFLKKKTEEGITDDDPRYPALLTEFFPGWDKPQELKPENLGLVISIFKSWPEKASWSETIGYQGTLAESLNALQRVANYAAVKYKEQHPEQKDLNVMYAAFAKQHPEKQYAVLLGDRVGKPGCATPSEIAHSFSQQGGRAVVVDVHFDASIFDVDQKDKIVSFAFNALYKLVNSWFEKTQGSFGGRPSIFKETGLDAKIQELERAFGTNDVVAISKATLELQLCIDEVKHRIDAEQINLDEKKTGRKAAFAALKQAVDGVSEHAVKRLAVASSAAVSVASPAIQNPLLTEQVDLTKYPTKLEQIDLASGNTITFGDMHGNTMKLIWNLIRCGAIEMTEQDFAALWNIYNASGLSDEFGQSTKEKCINELGFTLAQLQEFYAILGRVKVIPGHKIRLLGDTVSDRGQNDWLTLKVFEKLHQGGVATEIIASNHDLMLLAVYGNDVGKAWPDYAMLDQQRSEYALQGMIRKGLISHDEVKMMMEKHVIPSLKLLSYALSSDEQKITLFMHAPNSCQVIHDIANQLGVDYKAGTAKELAQTIDRINQAFALMRLEDNARYMKIIRVMASNSVMELDEPDQVLAVFAKLSWNRPKQAGKYALEEPSLQDKTITPDFVEHVVHGHIGQIDTEAEPHQAIITAGRQVNLDSDDGKRLYDYREKTVDTHDVGVNAVYNTAEDIELDLKERLVKAKIYVENWQTLSRISGLVSRPDPFKGKDGLDAKIVALSAALSSGSIVSIKAAMQVVNDEIKKIIAEHPEDLQQYLGKYWHSFSLLRYYTEDLQRLYDEPAIYILNPSLAPLAVAPQPFLAATVEDPEITKFKQELDARFAEEFWKIMKNPTLIQDAVSARKSVKLGEQYPLDAFDLFGKHLKIVDESRVSSSAMKLHGVSEDLIAEAERERLILDAVLNLVGTYAGLADPEHPELGTLFDRQLATLPKDDHGVITDQEKFRGITEAFKTTTARFIATLSAEKSAENKGKVKATIASIGTYQQRLAQNLPSEQFAKTFNGLNMNVVGAISLIITGKEKLEALLKSIATASSPSSLNDLYVAYANLHYGLDSFDQELQKLTAWLKATQADAKSTVEEKVECEKLLKIIAGLPAKVAEQSRVVVPGVARSQLCEDAFRVGLEIVVQRPDAQVQVQQLFQKMKEVRPVASGGFNLQVHAQLVAAAKKAGNLPLMQECWQKMQTQAGKLVDALTQHVIKLYQEIPPDQWYKAGGGRTQKTAPKVYEIVKVFNQMSEWAVRTILSESDLSARTVLLGAIIDMAYYAAFVKHDYYTARALLVSCKTNEVSRLTSTFAGLSPERNKHLQELDNLYSEDGNRKNVRAAVRENPLSVPALNLSLTDLTFALDGNPDRNRTDLGFYSVQAGGGDGQTLIDGGSKGQCKAKDAILPSLIRSMDGMAVISTATGAEDIPLDFLSYAGKMKDEEARYQRSLQLQPRTAQPDLTVLPKKDKISALLASDIRAKDLKLTTQVLQELKSKKIIPEWLVTYLTGKKIDFSVTISLQAFQNLLKALDNPPSNKELIKIFSALGVDVKADVIKVKNRIYLAKIKSADLRDLVEEALLTSSKLSENKDALAVIEKLNKAVEQADYRLVKQILVDECGISTDKTVGNFERFACVLKNESLIEENADKSRMKVFWNTAELLQQAVQKIADAKNAKEISVAYKEFKALVADIGKEQQAYIKDLAKYIAEAEAQCKVIAKLIPDCTVETTKQKLVAQQQKLIAKIEIYKKLQRYIEEGSGAEEVQLASFVDAKESAKKKLESVQALIDRYSPEAIAKAKEALAKIKAVLDVIAKDKTVLRGQELLGALEVDIENARKQPPLPRLSASDILDNHKINKAKITAALKSTGNLPVLIKELEEMGIMDHGLGDALTVYESLQQAVKEMDQCDRLVQVVAELRAYANGAAENIVMFQQEKAKGEDANTAIITTAKESLQIILDRVQKIAADLKEIKADTTTFFAGRVEIITVMDALIKDADDIRRNAAGNLLQMSAYASKYSKALIAAADALNKDDFDFAALATLGQDREAQRYFAEVGHLDERQYYISLVARHIVAAVKAKYSAITFSDKLEENELIQYRSNKPDTAPNVRAFIAFNEQLSAYVVNQVVSAPNLLESVVALENWIFIAAECFQQGELNSCMAIYAAINQVPIDRLKLVRNRLSPQAKLAYESLQQSFSDLKPEVLAPRSEEYKPVVPLLFPYLTLLDRADAKKDETQKAKIIDGFRSAHKKITQDKPPKLDNGFAVFMSKQQVDSKSQYDMSYRLEPKSQIFNRFSHCSKGLLDKIMAMDATSQQRKVFLQLVENPPATETFIAAMRKTGVEFIPEEVAEIKKAIYVAKISSPFIVALAQMFPKFQAPSAHKILGHETTEAYVQSINEELRNGDYERALGLLKQGSYLSHDFTEQQFISCIEGYKLLETEQKEAETRLVYSEAESGLEGAYNKLMAIVAKPRELRSDNWVAELVTSYKEITQESAINALQKKSEEIAAKLKLLEQRTQEVQKTYEDLLAKGVDKQSPQIVVMKKLLDDLVVLKKQTKEQLSVVQDLLSPDGLVARQQEAARDILLKEVHAQKVQDDFTVITEFLKLPTSKDLNENLIAIAALAAKTPQEFLQLDAAELARYKKIIAIFDGTSAEIVAVKKALDVLSKDGWQKHVDLLCGVAGVTAEDQEKLRNFSRLQQVQSQAQDFANKCRLQEAFAATDAVFKNTEVFIESSFKSSFTGLTPDTIAKQLEAVKAQTLVLQERARTTDKSWGLWHKEIEIRLNKLQRYERLLPLMLALKDNAALQGVLFDLGGLKSDPKLATTLTDAIQRQGGASVASDEDVKELRRAYFASKLGIKDQGLLQQLVDGINMPKGADTQLNIWVAKVWQEFVQTGNVSAKFWQEFKSPAFQALLTQNPEAEKVVQTINTIVLATLQANGNQAAVASAKKEGGPSLLAQEDLINIIPSKSLQKLFAPKTTGTTETAILTFDMLRGVLEVLNKLPNTTKLATELTRVLRINISEEIAADIKQDVLRHRLGSVIFETILENATMKAKSGSTQLVVGHISALLKELLKGSSDRRAENIMSDILANFKKIGVEFDFKKLSGKDGIIGKYLSAQGVTVDVDNGENVLHAVARMLVDATNKGDVTKQREAATIMHLLLADPDVARELNVVNKNGQTPLAIFSSDLNYSDLVGQGRSLSSVQINLIAILKSSEENGYRNSKGFDRLFVSANGVQYTAFKKLCLFDYGNAGRQDPSLATLLLKAREYTTKLYAQVKKDAGANWLENSARDSINSISGRFNISNRLIPAVAVAAMGEPWLTEWNKLSEKPEKEQLAGQDRLIRAWLFAKWKEIQGIPEIEERKLAAQKFLTSPAIVQILAESESKVSIIADLQELFVATQDSGMNDILMQKHMPGLMWLFLNSVEQFCTVQDGKVLLSSENYKQCFAQIEKVYVFLSSLINYKAKDFAEEFNKQTMLAAYVGMLKKKVSGLLGDTKETFVNMGLLACMQLVQENLLEREAEKTGKVFVAKLKDMAPEYFSLFLQALNIDIKDIPQIVKSIQETVNKLKGTLNELVERDAQKSLASKTIILEAFIIEKAEDINDVIRSIETGAVVAVEQLKAVSTVIPATVTVDTLTGSLTSFAAMQKAVADFDASVEATGLSIFAAIDELKVAEIKIDITPINDSYEKYKALVGRKAEIQQAQQALMKKVKACVMQNEAVQEFCGLLDEMRQFNSDGKDDAQIREEIDALSKRYKELKAKPEVASLIAVVSSPQHQDSLKEMVKGDADFGVVLDLLQNEKEIFSNLDGTEKLYATIQEGERLVRELTQESIDSKLERLLTLTLTEKDVSGIIREAKSALASVEKCLAELQKNRESNPEKIDPIIASLQDRRRWLVLLANADEMRVKSGVLTHNAGAKELTKLLNTILTQHKFAGPQFTEEDAAKIKQKYFRAFVQAPQPGDQKVAPVLQEILLEAGHLKTESRLLYGSTRTLITDIKKAWDDKDGARVVEVGHRLGVDIALPEGQLMSKAEQLRMGATMAMPSAILLINLADLHSGRGWMHDIVDPYNRDAKAVIDSSGQLLARPIDLSPDLDQAIQQYKQASAAIAAQLKSAQRLLDKNIVKRYQSQQDAFQKFVDANKDKANFETNWRTYFTEGIRDAGLVAEECEQSEREVRIAVQRLEEQQRQLQANFIQNFTDRLPGAVGKLLTDNGYTNDVAGLEKLQQDLQDITKPLSGEGKTKQEIKQSIAQVAQDVRVQKLSKIYNALKQLQQEAATFQIKLEDKPEFAKVFQMFSKLDAGSKALLNASFGMDQALQFIKDELAKIGKLGKDGYKKHYEQLGEVATLAKEGKNVETIAAKLGIAVSDVQQLMQEQEKLKALVILLRQSYKDIMFVLSAVGAGADDIMNTFMAFANRDKQVVGQLFESVIKNLSIDDRSAVKKSMDIFDIVVMDILFQIEPNEKLRGNYTQAFATYADAIRFSVSEKMPGFDTKRGEKTGRKLSDFVVSRPDEARSITDNVPKLQADLLKITQVDFAALTVPEKLATYKTQIEALDQIEKDLQETREKFATYHDENKLVLQQCNDFLQWVDHDPSAVVVKDLPYTQQIRATQRTMQQLCDDGEKTLQLIQKMQEGIVASKTAIKEGRLAITPTQIDVIKEQISSHNGLDAWLAEIEMLLQSLKEETNLSTIVAKVVEVEKTVTQLLQDVKAIQELAKASGYTLTAEDSALFDDCELFANQYKVLSQELLESKAELISSKFAEYSSQISTISSIDIGRFFVEKVMPKEAAATGVKPSIADITKELLTQEIAERLTSLRELRTHIENEKASLQATGVGSDTLKAYDALLRRIDLQIAELPKQAAVKVRDARVPGGMLDFPEKRSLQIRSLSYLEAAKLFIENSDLSKEDKDAIVNDIEAIFKPSAITVTSVSEFQDWLTKLVVFLADPKTHRPSNEAISQTAKQLMLAENIYVWQHGRVPVVTLSQHQYQQQLSGKLTQQTALQIDQASCHLTIEQIGECLSIFRADDSSPGRPGWFEKMPLFAQNYLKNRWQVFADRIKKDGVSIEAIADEFNAQYNPLPSALRGLPGMANRVDSSFVVLNKKGEVTSSLHTVSISTPLPIDAAKRKVSKEEQLRLTTQNIQQELEEYARKYIKDNPQAQSEPGQPIEFLTLVQSLLSPNVLNGIFGDNDRLMVKMKDDASRALSGREFKLNINGKDYWFKPNIVTTNHACNLYAKGAARVLLRSDEAPKRAQAVVNFLKGSGAVVMSKQFQDSMGAEELSVEVRSQLKALGEALSDSLSKLTKESVDKPKKSLTTSDPLVKSISTITGMISLLPKSQGNQNAQMLLAALHGYQQINAGKYYKKISKDESLFRAAFEVIITESLGGLSAGGCKSGKDRRGVVGMWLKAMQICYEQTGRSGFPNSANVEKNPELRARFIKVFIEVFKTYHTQYLAHQSALGVRALKSLKNVLPDDVYTALENDPVIGEAMLERDKELADQNKPEINNGIFQKLGRYFSNLVSAKPKPSVHVVAKPVVPTAKPAKKTAALTEERQPLLGEAPRSALDTSVASGQISPPVLARAPSHKAVSSDAGRTAGTVGMSVGTIVSLFATPAAGAVAGAVAGGGAWAVVTIRNSLNQRQAQKASGQLVDATVLPPQVEEGRPVVAATTEMETLLRHDERKDSVSIEVVFPKGAVGKPAFEWEGQVRLIDGALRTAATLNGYEIVSDPADIRTIKQGDMVKYILKQNGEEITDSRRLSSFQSVAAQQLLDSGVSLQVLGDSGKLDEVRGIVDGYQPPRMSATAA